MVTRQGASWANTLGSIGKALLLLKNDVEVLL